MKFQFLVAGLFPAASVVIEVPPCLSTELTSAWCTKETLHSLGCLSALGNMQSPGACENTGLQSQLPLEERNYGATAAQVRQGPLVSVSRSGSMKRAYVTAAVLCYVNLINFMDWFIVPGILLDIQGYFKLSDGDTGLLQTVFILCYMLAAPIFGYLGDRYNRKIILGAGVFFWSAVTLGSSFISEWITPCMGGLALVLLILLVPHRTQRRTAAHRALSISGTIRVKAEKPGVQRTAKTTWCQDVASLAKNWSFVWSSLGLTAMAFVTGALGTWVPLFLYRAEVAQGTEPPCLQESCNSSNSLIFGGITIGTGILGVTAGAEAARRLRKINSKADPLICATSMFISALCLYVALVMAQTNIISTFIFVAFGELFLSVNWAVVTDILLYVVTPRRQSTALALQILVSHLLGDAGSPYLIGTISNAIQANKVPSVQWSFWSMQYSFILCAFVGVLGGGFFLLTSFYIEEDRKEAEQL
ncbi:protein spinster homolog 3-like isoform X7 [Heliangelus exortis]|uniref:protein spinster homolog 3-like isoform X7 n=1 Tax=Heliangelus exortis TaxID=472823 RepID=UPI003A8E13C0